MKAPTAFLLHPDSALHDPGWGHVEHQGRLPALVHAIALDTLALQDVVLQREVDAASDDELLRVHTAAHIERIRTACEEAVRTGRPVLLEPDTPVSARSLDAARGAAGAALAAVDLVLDGEAATAFAATRPPGHHASADRAMGFCLFNNAALAAKRARERGIRRVLIVDWDVHHGNGTQDIFLQDPDVYVLSLHQSPHYPGTGAADERGVGAGTGTTRNVPLPPGLPAADYRRAFHDALSATLDEFAPEFIIVSAGFDCLAGDPLGNQNLEPADLHALTRTLLDATASTARGRLAAVLEGGYHPPRLGAGAVAMLRALADLPPQG